MLHLVGLSTHWILNNLRASSIKEEEIFNVLKHLNSPVERDRPNVRSLHSLREPGRTQRFHGRVHYIPSLITILSQCNKSFSIPSWRSTLTLQIYPRTDLPISLFLFKLITYAFVRLRIFYVSKVAARPNNSVFLSFMAALLFHSEYKLWNYSL